MAAGYVPDMKNEDIVCQSKCKHRDCAANRKQWIDGKCRICNKGFLPGKRFYYEDTGAVHALCLELEIEGDLN